MLKFAFSNKSFLGFHFRLARKKRFKVSVQNGMKTKFDESIVEPTGGLKTHLEVTNNNTRDSTTSFLSVCRR